MRLLIPFVAFIALAAASAHAAASAPVPKAKSNPAPEVIVVDDAAEKPAPEYTPAPGKPIHYLFLGAGERAFGSARAGKPKPGPHRLHEKISRVLALQGYGRT